MPETSALGAAVVGKTPLKYLYYFMLVSPALCHNFSIFMIHLEIRPGNLVLGLCSNLMSHKSYDSNCLPAGLAKGVEAWNLRRSIDLAMDRFNPRLTLNERDLRHEKWRNAVSRSMHWEDDFEGNPSKLKRDPQNSLLTKDQNLMRASVSPALFIFSSFVLWKISCSLSDL